MRKIFLALATFGVFTSAQTANAQTADVGFSAQVGGTYTITSNAASFTFPITNPGFASNSALNAVTLSYSGDTNFHVAIHGTTSTFTNGATGSMPVGSITWALCGQPDPTQCTSTGNYHPPVTLTTTAANIRANVAAGSYTNHSGLYFRLTVPSSTEKGNYTGTLRFSIIGA